jgi:hypothetical protein
MDGRGVTLTPGTTLRFDSLGCIYTGSVESIAGCTCGRPPRPNVLLGAATRKAFVRNYSGDIIISMLGPNPTQERFRLAAYYLTDLAFQDNGDEPPWYTAMYPCGQPGLLDDPVTAYVNSLCTVGVAPGSTTTRGGTDRATPRPHAGVQRLRGHRIEKLLIRASSVPPRRR